MRSSTAPTAPLSAIVHTGTEPWNAAENVDNFRNPIPEFHKLHARYTVQNAQRTDCSAYENNPAAACFRLYRAAGELDKLLPLDKYRSLLHLLIMIAVPGAGCFPEAAPKGAPLISLNMRPGPTPPTWLRAANSWPILQQKGSMPKRGTLEVRARRHRRPAPGSEDPLQGRPDRRGTPRVRSPLKRAPETEDSPEAALEGSPRMALNPLNAAMRSGARCGWRVRPGRSLGSRCTGNIDSPVSQASAHRPDGIQPGNASPCAFRSFQGIASRPARVCNVRFMLYSPTGTTSSAKIPGPVGDV